MNAVAQTSSTLALHAEWHRLPVEARLSAFGQLSRIDADDFFLSLSTVDQAELIGQMPDGERRLWVRLLAPDDLTDVLQELQPGLRSVVMKQLDEPTRKEVIALMAYTEDVAGGLMNPRFPRLRQDMQVEEALRYLRKQAPHVETLRYAYVLDAEQHLLGVASLRHLFASDGDKLVSEVMRTNVIFAEATMSQEEIKNLFKASALMNIPVLDGQHRMVGIITVDDMVDVVEEEATEDIQRLGGSEVLDAPYLTVRLPDMIKKRAGWLVILFLSEMLTATAMGHYEDEIAKAVVLALFIPLIISSGGNSGSQASTLVVRAMALNEVRLRDWWRICWREVFIGGALGLILGGIGYLRVLVWPNRAEVYGPHYAQVGLTVGISVFGVVLWGSVSGSMLPFVLKRFGLDPATASAPFVATMVDVAGLVIYFTMASVILRGTLL